MEFESTALNGNPLNCLLRFFYSWRFHLIWKAGMPRSLLHLKRFLFKHQDARVCSSGMEEKEEGGVTEGDLNMLLAYADERDGGPPWRLIMDHTTPTLSFKTWRREPKFGPTEYRSQTIFENVGPELLRDFFWDDDFRTKWDHMFVNFGTLREYPQTGTMVVKWIRKFPFFFGHREYIIARRIWVSRSTYYCISKSVPFPGIPRSHRRRRVDRYYSSWRIKEVESRNGGQSIASEVLLFHHEDMGIPKMLAKLGVQRTMRGLLEKMELGVHAYRSSRLNGTPPSRYALKARTATKIPNTNLRMDETHFPEDHINEVEINNFVLKLKTMAWLIAGGLVFHIIRGIRTFYNKGDRDVGLFTDHEEIAKRVKELGDASKPLGEMIQKGQKIASRPGQVLREQTRVSKLLGRCIWCGDPWPIIAVMRMFGWRLKYSSML